MKTNWNNYGRAASLSLISSDVSWTRRQMVDLRSFSRKALENRLLEAAAIAEYGIEVGERMGDFALEGGRRALPVLRRRGLWEWAALWGGISLWLLY